MRTGPCHRSALPGEEALISHPKPSIYLSIYTCFCIHLSVYIYISIYLYIYIFTYLFIYIYLSISIYLSPNSKRSSQALLRVQSRRPLQWRNDICMWLLWRICIWIMFDIRLSSTQTLPPSLKLKWSNLNPKTLTSAVFVRFQARPLHQTPNLNPKPKTRDPKHKTQNPKPQTQNPRPKTQNPKPKTQGPKSRP